MYVRHIPEHHVPGSRWAARECTQRAMATEYGVTFQHISAICLNKFRKVPA